MKRKAIFLAVFLVLIFLFLGCEGAGKITGPSPITSDNTGNAEVKDSDLYKYVAAFNGGRTVRWNKDVITVYDGINEPAIQGFLDEWNQYLNGRRLVLTTNSNADITINYGIKAATYFAQSQSDYEFTHSWIEMENLPHIESFKMAVKHEIGHAIGFLGHTSDGGLMDAYGNTGNITSTVTNVVRRLYELPPGTKVVPG